MINISSFKEIENFAFLSLINGSLCSIIKIRKLLADVLYKNGKCYDNRNLMYQSIKMFILAGEWDTVKKIISFEWDFLFEILSTTANDLWMLSNYSNLQSKMTKICLIQTLGLYFNEANFEEAFSFLSTIIPKATSSEIPYLLEAIFMNKLRFKNEEVVLLITSTLKNKGTIQNPASEKYLRSILLNLETQDVSRKNLLSFKNQLKKESEFLNENPQIIARLIRLNSDIFSSLKNDVLMDSTDKELFDINIGDNKSRNEAILSLIKDIEVKFEATKISYIYGSEFKTIKQLLNRESNQKLLIPTLTHDFIPLAIRIFTEKMVLNGMIEDCIECLMDVVIILKEHDVPINNELIDTIKTFKIKEDNDVFSYSTNKSLFYRMTALKAILNLDIKDEILLNYLSYSQDNFHERLALAKCIYQYSVNCIKTGCDFDDLFFMITIQMSNSSEYEIRRETVLIFGNIQTPYYFNIINQKFIELSVDPNPYVRDAILYLIRTKKIQDTDLSKKILEDFQRDSHIVIKKMADEIFVEQNQ